MRQKTSMRVELITNRPQKKRMVFEMLLTAFLVSVSVLFLLFEFRLPYSKIPVFFFLAACPVALSFLAQKIGGRRFAYSLLVVMALLCAFFYKPLWNGFLVLVNHMFMNISSNPYGGFAFVRFETGIAPEQEVFYATAALLFGTLVFSSAMVWAVRNRLLAVIVILCASFLYLVERYTLASGMSLVTGLGLVLATAFCSIGSGRKRTLNISPKNDGRLTVILSGVLLLLIAAFYALFSSVISLDNYYFKLNGVSGIKEGLNAAVESFRYGKSSGITELSRGDFNGMESLYFTGNEALLVMMEKPRSVYLKGFTGSEYWGWGNRWHTSDNVAYYQGSEYSHTPGEFAGIFEWLGHFGFYPHLQLGRVGSMTMGAQSGWISVQNSALSSRYIYAPYETLPTEDMDSGYVEYKEDTDILSKGFFGTRKYTFDMYLPVVEDYGAVDLFYWLGEEVLDNPAYHEYLTYEKVYRTFVYDYYLEVSWREDAILEAYFGRTLSELQNRDYREVVRDIREFFSQNFSFSYEIETLEENADFIADFLSGGIGYDAHFSTLAALLLRKAGIPARYAEGFYITPADVDIYTEMSSVSFSLPDSAAHAWVEVYVDGIGWLPVEFTPGFYTLIKNDTSNEGITQVLQDNPRYFYQAEKEEPLEEIPPEEESPRANPRFLPLFIALFAVLLYTVIRMIYIKNRRRGFTREDSRRGTLRLYAYFARLLRFEGIISDHTAVCAVLDRAGGRYDFEGFSLKGFLEVVNKARFSPPERRLNQEDTAYARDYVAAAARLLYRRQNWFRRMIMRFIWLL